MPRKTKNYPVIKVSPRFSILGDAHCWILRESYKTKTRTKPVRTLTRVRETYHGSLSHVLQTITERSLKDAKSLDELAQKLDTFAAMVKQATKKVETKYNYGLSTNAED